jgi:SAM-dependent methyltransferase
MDSIAKDLADLERHYSALVRQYGDDPRSAQQSDRSTQERRMAVLAEIGDIQDAEIFDFGCGTGHFLTYLTSACGFRGRYIGCDLSPEALKLARRNHPEATFVATDVLSDGVGQTIDYAFASGTFNNRIGDNWGFLTRAVDAIFPSVRRGLAFNLISSYVDYCDPSLYYADPEEVFRFCREHLSTRVALRHDYQLKTAILPYEFTVYVYKDALPCRAKRMV